MGNALGGSRSAKVMKINGETIKLKTPVQAGEVTKGYPGYVVLESQAVKQFGIRARPLETWQELKPKKLYFLVELPKYQEENKVPRRVRSGINMSAKDRLESLMLSRRSVSDLSFARPSGIVPVSQQKEGSDQTNGMTRVKVRLPKSEVAKLMMESKDQAEVAEKIVGLYMAADGGAPPLCHQQQHWKSSGNGGLVNGGFKAREKRVGFLPMTEGEIQLAVA